MNIFKFKKRVRQKTLAEIKTEILMKRGREQLRKLTRMGLDIPIKIAY